MFRERFDRVSKIEHNTQYVHFYLNVSHQCQRGNYPSSICPVRALHDTHRDSVKWNFTQCMDYNKVGLITLLYGQL